MTSGLWHFASQGSEPHIRWDAQRERLEQQVQEKEQLKLLCVAPARHVSADSLRSEKVWIGIVQAPNTNNHFVFLFHRRLSWCATLCLRKFIDAVYCVVPVASNIQIETDVNRCTFLWRANVKKYQLTSGAARSRYGDLFIERIKDPSGHVLEVLQNCHKEACDNNIVFHEGSADSKGTHQEILNYADCIPLDISTLYKSSSSVPRRQNKTTSTGGSYSASASRLQFLCVTWNVGATLPNSARSLRAILDTVWNADVVVVGLQEICQLSAMRLVQDGTEVQVWRDWVEKEVKSSNTSMVLLEYSHLVGMLMLVFVHENLRKEITDLRTTSIGVGVGGMGGNKGAVAVRFSLQDETSVCIINAHMAAGQEGYIERCQNFRDVTNKMRFMDGYTHSNVGQATAGAGGGKAEPLLKEEEQQDIRHTRTHTTASGSSSSSPGVPGAAAAGVGAWGVNDHTHVIWLGDTNSRLHWPGKLGGMPIEQAIEKVQESRFGELLALDQLNMMRKDGLAFEDYEEHKICFLPSYKWRPDSNQMDMRTQKHVPAWCDRVLVRSVSHPPAQITRYDVHLDLKQSDHRPVYALIGVPYSGSSAAADAELGLDDMDTEGGLPQMMTEPSEVTFDSLKPDEPQEVTLKLYFKSTGFQGKCRWKAMVRPSCEGGIVSMMTSMASAAASAAGSRGEQDSKTLAHSLQITPSEGTFDVSSAMEVKVSVNFVEYVFSRRSTDVFLMLRLYFGPGKEKTEHFQIRAVLEPSIMRLPLATLAGLGTTTVASAATLRRRNSSWARAASRRLSVSISADEAAHGESVTPPKEVIAVMTWLVQRSEEAEPGSFKWWPDPLAEGRVLQHMKKIQHKVEHGEPLEFQDVDDAEGLCYGAVKLLLHWVQLLPDPIVGQQILRLSAGMGPATALRTMMVLPRSVLVCIAAMLMKIMDRHGQVADAVRRVAAATAQLACSMRQSGRSSSVGQQTNASLAAEAERILANTMEQLRKEGGGSFPPWAALAAYSKSFAEEEADD